MKRFIALLVSFAFVSSASAFYFPGWPGAARPPQPVLVNQWTAGDPPSITPPQIPETITKIPEEPNGVPEPATFTLGALGIVMVIRKLARGKPGKS